MTHSYHVTTAKHYIYIRLQFKVTLKIFLQRLQQRKLYIYNQKTFDRKRESKDW